jgi:hypothetical protein
LFYFFRPLGKDTVLESKYKEVFDLSERMTFLHKHKRPNCDEMLEKKDKWALSFSQYEEFTGSLPKRTKYSEAVFHLFFVQIKNPQ